MYSFKCDVCKLSEDKVVPFDTKFIKCACCDKKAKRDTAIEPCNWQMDGNTGAQREG